MRGVGRCVRPPHPWDMARLSLTLEVDVESFQRVVDRQIAADLQVAMVEGLNVAGEAGVKAVRKGMATAFDRPNPSTLAGVQMYRATARTDGGDPSVLIYIRDQTALFLDNHVEVGVRRAGAPFVTIVGSFIHGHPASSSRKFGFSGTASRQLVR